MNISAEFQNSYQRFETYPLNLIHQALCSFTLESYKRRLDDVSAERFLRNDQDANVPVLESPQPGHRDFSETIVTNAATLNACLGDQSTVDPLSLRRVGPCATRADPKCRFIFLWAAHSRARVKITKEMLSQILTYHQVSPSYLHFLFAFGQQIKPHNTRFGGFREHTTLSDPPQGQIMHDLCRSGKQLQLCYNLKSVACTIPDEPVKHKQMWSIRQVAVYHQFDVEEGTTLWILLKAKLDLKECIQKMTGSTGRPEDRAFSTEQQCFRSSLPIHLLLAHWASDEWRWYIEWLEDVVEHETRSAILGPRGPDDAKKIYVPEHLQTVQHLEEKINEAIMVLETNINVLEHLCKYYETLLSNVNFALRTHCAGAVRGFAAQICDAIYDLQMQKERAKLLVQLTSERRSLISQHMQTQATDNMELLTINMQNIGVLAQKEAIAMKIVTVVTLVYLPATFVSVCQSSVKCAGSSLTNITTFFSTDVVHYLPQDSSEDQQSSTTIFSSLAMFRWLEVALPLTVLTMIICWYAYRWTAKKQRTKLSFYELQSKTVGIV